MQSQDENQLCKINYCNKNRIIKLSFEALLCTHNIQKNCEEASSQLYFMTSLIKWQLFTINAYTVDPHLSELIGSWVFSDNCG